MLEAADVADAWERLVPGMEPGTLRSRLSGENQGNFANYALAQIKLKRLTKEQLQADDGGELSDQHRILMIWRQHLLEAGAPDPKDKDWVVDSSGVTWVVEKVLEHKLLGEVHNSLVHRKAGP